MLDGELDDFFGVEEARVEAVALAGEDDELDEIGGIFIFVNLEELGGVGSEGDDFIHIAMDEAGGDAGAGEFWDE